MKFRCGSYVPIKEPHPWAVAVIAFGESTILRGFHYILIIQWGLGVSSQETITESF